MNRLLRVLVPSCVMLAIVALCSCAGRVVTAESTIPSVATNVPLVSTSASPALSKLDLALLEARQRQVATPQQLAERIQQCEDGIHFSGTPLTDLAPLGALESDAFAQLVAEPAWQTAVIALLPDRVRPGAQANLSAGSQIASLNGQRAALPHWAVQAPASAADLLAYYHEAEQAYGIPWQYLAAVNFIETQMGRIRGLSTAGAQGPMQFLPAVWVYYSSGDINNPRDAILAAGRFLMVHGGPQDMPRALYRYNPSNEYVNAVTLYAQQMQADVRAFYAYYHWQVYVSTTSGLALLPEGFSN